MTIADPFANLGQSSDPFANFKPITKPDPFADPFAELDKPIGGLKAPYQSGFWTNACCKQTFDNSFKINKH